MPYSLIEPTVWGRLGALDPRCDWSIERANVSAGPAGSGRRHYSRAWTMKIWLRDEPGPRLITSTGPVFAEVLADTIRMAESAGWHLPAEESGGRSWQT